MNKKFLSLALLLASVFSFVSLPSAHAIGEPNFAEWENKSDKGGDRHPARVLKMVRNPLRGQDDTSLVSGDVVVVDTVSDDGLTVTRTTNSHDNAIAGIVVTTIPTADSNSTIYTEDRGRRNWGWIIVHGPANARITAGGAGGAAARDAFITSTDSGTVTDANAISGGNDADTLATAMGRGGFFLDAPGASDTSAEVFVQLE